MGVQDYRDLIVWQKAMNLAKLCYQVVKQFPKEALFAMSSQIRRAGINSREHRRRQRPGAYQGIPESPEYCPGFLGGT
jgi:23S rRNA-intervening sequence protein